jgi:hypothetical protein
MLEHNLEAYRLVQFNVSQNEKLQVMFHSLANSASSFSPKSGRCWVFPGVFYVQTFPKSYLDYSSCCPLDTVGWLLILSPTSRLFCTPVWSTSLKFTLSLQLSVSPRFETPNSLQRQNLSFAPTAIKFSGLLQLLRAESNPFNSQTFSSQLSQTQIYH